MTSIPDNNPAEPDAVSDRALAEPLPSPEMLLASFAGVRPVTDIDILDPAFDLVACQREERVADEALINEAASLDERRAAGRSLAAAPMAELWELLNAREPDDLDPPEAVLLSEQCDGYDALAAEIEAGQQIAAGA